MTGIDLFCGAGGLSRGLTQAGVEMVLGVDCWADALRVHHHNLGGPVLELDLMSSGVARRLPRVDLVAGSPPCQEFSAAHHQRREGERAALTVRFAKIVRELQPQFFLMENVPLTRRSTTYARAAAILRPLYGWTEVVLDAADYGVPQHRERLIVIGRLGGRDGEFRGPLMAGASEKPMTVRRYCGDDLAIRYFYRQPHEPGKRGVFSVDEPCPTITSLSRRRRSRFYQSRPRDATSDLSLVRSLTLREAALIQTFRPPWDWPGLRELDAWTMVANAVPPALARYIGEVLLGGRPPAGKKK